MVQSRLQRVYAIDEGPRGGPGMREPSLPAAIRDGDVIEIDIPNRRLDVRLSQDELADRLRHCSPPSKQIPPGFLRLHARHVGPASKGAVLSDDAGLLVNWHLGPFIVGCT